MASTTRQRPDEKIGRSIEEARTWDEARELGDLNWGVEERTIRYLIGDKRLPVATHKAMVRSDNHELLGIVGQTYSPIQNRDAGAWLTPLVESGAARFLRAGAVRGGSVVYATVQLGDEIEIQVPSDMRGSETVERFRPELTMSTSHDGSHQLRMSLMVMRLICVNGLVLPVAARERIIRHVGDTDSKVAIAERATEMWAAYMPRFEEAARNLAGKKMSWEEIESFTRRLIPSPREAAGEEAAKQTATARESLLGILRHAPDLEGSRDSAWGVYNAVAEYADHAVIYRGGSRATPDERRFMAILDGSAVDLKDRAYRMLVN